MELQPDTVVGLAGKSLRHLHAENFLQRQHPGEQQYSGSQQLPQQQLVAGTEATAPAAHPKRKAATEEPGLAVPEEADIPRVDTETPATDADVPEGESRDDAGHPADKQPQRRRAKKQKKTKSLGGPTVNCGIAPLRVKLRVVQTAVQYALRLGERHPRALGVDVTGRERLAGVWLVVLEGLGASQYDLCREAMPNLDRVEMVRTGHFPRP